MLPNQTIKQNKKLWLLFIASVYFVGSIQFLFLEGLHEVSHLLSKVESHPHEIDHISGKEHSHHHKTIAFISKLFSPSKTPHKENEALSFQSIDKHFSPKTMGFIVFEPKKYKEFPAYNKLLQTPFLKIALPPPKDFVSFSM